MYCRIVLLGTLLISACTSVDVRPVESSLGINHVCIEENPKVAVSDFKQVLRDGFGRHGIATTVMSGQRLDQCTYVLQYTARRSWDFKPFLSLASLSLERDGLQIAYADYRHSGGFALNKWASTKEKMDPVIDQLLVDYQFDPNAEAYVAPSQPEPAANLVKADKQGSGADGDSDSPKDLYKELIKLDDLRKNGILTEAEFDSEKKKLLEKN